MGAEPLLFYTTAGCHLCEQAQALLAATDAEWTTVDIAMDAQLMERYGVRIPVLRRSDGVELGWPFDAASLAAFLSARG